MLVVMPDCPLVLTLYGESEARENFKKTSIIDYQTLAQECLNKNPKSYWVIFKSGDTEPLEHGEFKTKLEVNDEELSEKLFAVVSEKYNIQSPDILVYLEKPDTLTAVRHVKSMLIHAGEQAVVQSLHDKGFV